MRKIKDLRLRATIVAAIASTLALVVGACNDTTTRPSGPPTVSTPSPGAATTPVASSFVGNEACAECHPAEMKQHKGGRHDLSLRFADTESLARERMPMGRVKNTDYQFGILGDRYAFGLVGGAMRPLDMAFGSGKSGIAFTVLAGKDAMAEARISYFPPGHSFYITPGQQGLSDRSLGNLARGDAARQCFPCHTITMPTDSLVPEKRFLGVGCESCHGAGGAHIDAVRRKDLANLRMERLGGLGGTRINAECGKCHRTAEDVASKNLPAQKTDLFQAHGLAQSRCFKESRDRLTCLTCHNPHTDVNTNEAQYESVCLDCHGGRKVANTSDVKAGPCPVNPTAKCIGCHMTRRPEPLFPGHKRMVADHFIRIAMKEAKKMEPR